MTRQPCGIVASCSRPAGHRGQHGGYRRLVRDVDLTPQQLRVLAAWARAGSLKAAAAHLGMSLNTAKVHTLDAYRTLGVSGQTEAHAVLGWLVVPGEAEIERMVVRRERTRLEARLAELPEVPA